MDRITLPKNSTDSFITLLIYSDRGAMIAVENITEIQSYVGSTQSRDFNKSFRESKLSLRPGHASYGAELLPGTLLAKVKNSNDSSLKGSSVGSQGDESWGVVTHFGGVLTMVENVCELHTPNINTEFPTEAFKNNALDLNYLYSWVWFNQWERFISRWQNILIERGYIEEKFIEMLSTVTPGNDDSIATSVRYIKNVVQKLLRDKVDDDPQTLVLIAAARRPYSYTTLDELKDRSNLQNLLESTVGTEDDNFGDELKIFDDSKEVFDFNVPEQILT